MSILMKMWACHLAWFPPPVGAWRAWGGGQRVSGSSAKIGRAMRCKSVQLARGKSRAVYLDASDASDVLALALALALGLALGQGQDSV